MKEKGQGVEKIGKLGGSSKDLKLGSSKVGTNSLPPGLLDKICKKSSPKTYDY